MRERYGVPLIVMHWLILLLIIAAYVMGTILEDMAFSPAKLRLYAWHKWVGMLVLFLVPLRIGLRLAESLDHRRGLTPFEVRVSAIVHGLLYLLLIAAPMLGWLHSSAEGFPVVWFGVLPLPDLVDSFGWSLHTLAGFAAMLAVYTAIIWATRFTFAPQADGWRLSRRAKLLVPGFVALSVSILLLVNVGGG